MTNIKKDVEHTLDDPVVKNLLKFDIFMFVTIIVTGISYYQIIGMFNTEHYPTIYVSLAIGFIFTGILFLSVRQWRNR